MNQANNKRCKTLFLLVSGLMDSVDNLTNRLASVKEAVNDVREDSANDAPTLVRQVELAARNNELARLSDAIEEATQAALCLAAAKDKLADVAMSISSARFGK